MKIRLFAVVVLFWSAFCIVPSSAFCAGKIPDGFVEIRQVIPSILMDIRYYTPHNFVGARVDGYNAPKCYLTKPAAQALAKVQEELLQYSLSLKVYDCYRPQTAVKHFVRWAKDVGDIKTKGEFYPDVDKKNLFSQGYIAHKSGHSRGSTVDLTVVPLPAPEQEKYTPGQPLVDCRQPAGERFKDNGFDMGSGFDCFDEIAATACPNVGPQQRLNRLFLKLIMEKYGFTNFEREWWHYTLKNEPYPDTYFDFPIE